VLSVASLIAEAIRRIHNEESVSSLFIEGRRAIMMPEAFRLFERSTTGDQRRA
jgi:hypothetical protein